MNCTKCGSDNYSEANFCRKCGASLEEQRKVAAIAEEERRKLEVERIAAERRAREDLWRNRFLWLRKFLWGNALRRSLAIGALAIGVGLYAFSWWTNRPPSMEQANVELIKQLSEDSDNRLVLTSFNVARANVWHKADGRTRYYVAEYEASVHSTGSTPLAGTTKYRAGTLQNETLSGHLVFESKKDATDSWSAWRAYDGTCVFGKLSPSAEWPNLTLNCISREFMHNGSFMPHPSNKGWYYFTGSSATCVRATETCRAGPRGHYDVLYNGQGDSFSIGIDHPLSESRAAAEQFLVNALGIPKELRVFVETSG